MQSNFASTTALKRHVINLHDQKVCSFNFFVQYPDVVVMASKGHPAFIKFIFSNLHWFLYRPLGTQHDTRWYRKYSLSKKYSLYWQYVVYIVKAYL